MRRSISIKQITFGLHLRGSEDSLDQKKNAQRECETQLGTLNPNPGGCVKLKGWVVHRKSTAAAGAPNAAKEYSN